MSFIQLRIIGISSFFLFIFISGVWLSRSGRPLNVVILAIHKLLSLLVVVFIAVTIYQINQEVKIGTIELSASVVTGLLFLFTFISGGLLSTGKPVQAAVLAIHKVTPLLTLLSAAATMYLLH
jgi:hypothetical protein